MRGEDYEGLNDNPAADKMVDTPRGAWCNRSHTRTRVLHCVAADEVWHFYDGSPLLVHTIDPHGNHSVIKLGQNAEAGEQFQCVVPGGHWFGSCLEEPDRYALVGCTVAPGFDFADFRIAARADLLAQYPQHRDVIHKLTREQ